MQVHPLPSKPSISKTSYPVWSGELWTAKQRQMHRQHYVISYRASFKPEIPDFFIRHYLLKQGITKARILDPFGGRGTTLLQANMLGFPCFHNDLNPVSIFLARSRQKIPNLKTLIKRVEALPLEQTKALISIKDNARLLPFFHKRTLNEILNLRKILVQKQGKDPVLNYIGLTALSRLHGHSTGFLSVYSFPQISILPQAQRKNNQRRGQKPEYRDVKSRIIRKIKIDLSMPLPEIYTKAAEANQYMQEDARSLRGVATNSIDLIITSPPFLDKVDYKTDNWMRAWFLDMEEKLENTPLSILSNLNLWCEFMRDVMREMGRVLKPGGHGVIEVGEVSVHSQCENLEERLIQLLPLHTMGGRSMKLVIKEVFINQQNFTKLSNCWSVANNQKGTNTNRCLVVQKIEA